VTIPNTAQVYRATSDVAFAGKPELKQAALAFDYYAILRGLQNTSAWEESVNGIGDSAMTDLQTKRSIGT
jgi:hypothetical protein